MTALGIPVTIPEKMIKEMPFPIPLSVICSPSHIKNAVPAASVIMVMMRNDAPGCWTKAPLFIFSNPTAMPNDWIRVMAIVP